MIRSNTAKQICAIVMILAAVPSCVLAQDAIDGLTSLLKKTTSADQVSPTSPPLLSIDIVEGVQEKPVTLAPINVGDITIIIPISSGDLPPDPGEAGKVSLSGIDVDGDGVRDDLERSIAYKYPKEPSTRHALYQYSMALSGLISSNDQVGVLTNAQLMMEKRACILNVRSIVGDGVIVADEILAEMLNTMDRSMAFIRATGSMSGILNGASVPSSMFRCR